MADPRFPKAPNCVFDSVTIPYNVRQPRTITVGVGFTAGDAPELERTFNVTLSEAKQLVCRTTRDGLLGETVKSELTGSGWMSADEIYGAYDVDAVDLMDPCRWQLGGTSIKSVTPRRMILVMRLDGRRMPSADVVDGLRACKQAGKSCDDAYPKSLPVHEMCQWLFTSIGIGRRFAGMVDPVADVNSLLQLPTQQPQPLAALMMKSGYTIRPFRTLTVVMTSDMFRQRERGYKNAFMLASNGQTPCILPPMAALQFTGDISLKDMVNLFDEQLHLKHLPIHSQSDVMCIWQRPADGTLAEFAQSHPMTTTTVASFAVLLCNALTAMDKNGIHTGGFDCRTLLVDTVGRMMYAPAESVQSGVFCRLLDTDGPSGVTHVPMFYDFWPSDVPNYNTGLLDIPPELFFSQSLKYFLGIDATPCPLHTRGHDMYHLNMVILELLLGHHPTLQVDDTKSEYVSRIAWDTPGAMRLGDVSESKIDLFEKDILRYLSVTQWPPRARRIFRRMLHHFIALYMLFGPPPDDKLYTNVPVLARFKELVGPMMESPSSSSSSSATAGNTKYANVRRAMNNAIGSFATMLKPWDATLRATDEYSKTIHDKARDFLSPYNMKNITDPRDIVLKNDALNLPDMTATILLPSIATTSASSSKSTATPMDIDKTTD
jgi:hypothetical protein